MTWRRITDITIRKGQGSKTKVAREQDTPLQFSPNPQVNESDGEKVDSDDERAVNWDVSSKGKRVHNNIKTNKRYSWWCVCKWILFSIIKAWRSTKQGKEGCYMERTCISIRCIWYVKCLEKCYCCNSWLKM